MRLTPYSLLIVLVTVLASCGSKNSVPVPADADIVLHFDGKSINSKYPWEEFKKTELYSDAFATEKDSLAKKLLENPANSGVDLQGDIFYFMKKRSGGSYSVFTGVLKDDDAFAATLKKSFGGEGLEKEGNLNVIAISPIRYITWNSNRFVMVGSESPSRRSFGNPDKFSMSNESMGKDSLLKFANEVYNMKESASIGNDKRFTEMMQQSGDLHFWVTSAGAMTDMPANLPINVDDLIKGNVTAATISFDNGKITGKTKSYYNEKLTEFYAKNPPKTISEDMLKQIPSGDVAAVFAVNYPVPVIKDILMMTGAYSIGDVALKQQGFNLEDILRSLKGDFFMTVKDVKMEMPSEPMMGKPQPKVNMLLGASLSEPATFDSLLAFARTKMGEVEKSGEGKVMTYEMIQQSFPHRVQNGWFFLGTDSSLLNSYGKTSTDHPFIKKISGHQLGAYINIQKLINDFKAAAPDAESFLGLASSTWKDIIAYGDGVKDGVSDGYFEINLVDQNTGSLKQIVNFIASMKNAMEVKMKEQQLRYQKMMESGEMGDLKIDELQLEDVKPE